MLNAQLKSTQDELNKPELECHVTLD